MVERYGPTPTGQGVQGYRNLSDAEIQRINVIKEHEVALAELWQAVGSDFAGADRRWLAVARTHFQEGFSALVRSIARPDDPFASAGPAGVSGG